MNRQLKSEQGVDRVAACYASQRDFVTALVRRAGIPASEVDDAVQDVFCVLLGRIHELCETESLRGWLAVVAGFVCRNRRRGERRRARWLDCAGRLDPDQERAAASLFRASSATQVELRHALEQALAALSSRQRDVLCMSLLEERSAREIGELLGVSPNTVSSRLRIARKLAQEELLRAREEEDRSAA